MCTRVWVCVNPSSPDRTASLREMAVCAGPESADKDICQSAGQTWTRCVCVCLQVTQFVSKKCNLAYQKQRLTYLLKYNLSTKINFSCLLCSKPGPDPILRPESNSTTPVWFVLSLKPSLCGALLVLSAQESQRCAAVSQQPEAGAPACSLSTG